LHGPKTETVLLTSRDTLPLAAPSTSNDEDESITPATDIVADGADDLDSLRLRASGITLDIRNATHVPLVLILLWILVVHGDFLLHFDFHGHVDLIAHW
jgi:hypothetical protein